MILHYELNGWGWVENENKETGWVPLITIQLMDEKSRFHEIGILFSNSENNEILYNLIVCLNTIRPVLNPVEILPQP